MKYTVQLRLYRTLAVFSMLFAFAACFGAAISMSAASAPVPCHCQRQARSVRTAKNKPQRPSMRLRAEKRQRQRQRALDKLRASALDSPGGRATHGFDVYQRDLREVADDMGRKVAWNILVDPGIEEEVSLSMRGVTWFDALVVIAKLTNCEIALVAPHTIKLSQAPKVTIEFSNGDVRTALRLLSLYAGRNIIVSDKIQGKLTMALKDMPWDRALEAIVDTVDDAQIIDDGDVLRVVPWDE